MGFTVDHNVLEEKLSGGELRAHLHTALDQIMDRMERVTDMHGGAATLEGTCERDHVHALRLTLADITDEKLCVWCDGTGIEGS